MKKNMLIAVLGFFFIFTQTIPVRAILLPFLTIFPSQQANGMGNTYGNLADVEPMASRFNPAFAGFFAQKHHFGFSHLDRNWLPDLNTDLRITCVSFNLGYSLKKLPLVFGLTYHHSLLDLGEVSIPEPPPGMKILATYEMFDKADIIGTSVLLDYYFQVAIGINIKFFESRGSIFPSKTSHTRALDLGIAAAVPLFEILKKTRGRTCAISKNVKPFFQPGFYYSVANWGDEVTDSGYYVSTLPVALGGFNTQFGFQYHSPDFQFNLVAVHWANEFEGDLSQWNNAEHRYDYYYFKWDPDEIVEKHGWQVNFLDIIFLRCGQYTNESSQVSFDTHGFGINLMQPLRLLLHFNNWNFKNNLLQKGMKALDIEYHQSGADGRTYSTLEAGTPREFFHDNNFNGFVVKLKTIY